jgi:predicted component of viral defense system (DUF524 family)
MIKYTETDIGTFVKIKNEDGEVLLINHINGKNKEKSEELMKEIRKQLNKEFDDFPESLRRISWEAEKETLFTISGVYDTLDKDGKVKILSSIQDWISKEKESLG